MQPITFKSHIELLPKLKLHHVTVPAEIVDEVGGIGTRLMCSINEHAPFHSGMVALGGGAAYITVNKKRMKKFGVGKGDEVTVSIELDDSKYGMEVPEELEALLEQDREGARRFEMLAPSKQRYIIHYVFQVKSSQKKIDRAIMLINNLKSMPEDEFDIRKLLGLPPREN
ncbi:YdeI/OmpD-associated family protein [Gracilimonas sp.]|uniref:YdeI/OmpD-associated family protein n=1 Tax=Gracilimonas sp. TaxID=1974203 RepID=UPI002871D3D1|nr:YdeI/OmpD-associated family protein [Gracilimonas sp.]